MDWDKIVSNILSNTTIYLLGRLMDIAVSYWHTRHNK